jgi:hypothetical protein
VGLERCAIYNAPRLCWNNRRHVTIADHSESFSPITYERKYSTAQKDQSDHIRTKVFYGTERSFPSPNRELGGGGCNVVACCNVVSIEKRRPMRGRCDILVPWNRSPTAATNNVMNNTQCFKKRSCLGGKTSIGPQFFRIDSFGRGAGQQKKWRDCERSR